MGTVSSLSPRQIVYKTKTKYKRVTKETWFLLSGLHALQFDATLLVSRGSDSWETGTSTGQGHGGSSASDRIQGAHQFAPDTISCAATGLERAFQAFSPDRMGGVRILEIGDTANYRLEMGFLSQFLLVVLVVMAALLQLVMIGSNIERKGFAGLRGGTVSATAQAMIRVCIHGNCE